MILDIYNDSIKYSIKNSKSLLYFGLTLFSTFIIWMAYILILIHYQDANLNLKFASLIVPSLLTLIPIFLFLGYEYRILEISTHGMINGTDKVPEFNNLKEMLINGVKIFLVKFVYFAVPIIILAVTTTPFLDNISGGIIQTAGATISMILAIILYFVSFISLSNMAAHDNFKKAFDFKEIKEVILTIGPARYVLFYIGLLIIECVIAFVLFAITMIAMMIIGTSGINTLTSPEPLWWAMFFLTNLIFSLIIALAELFKTRGIGLIYEPVEGCPPKLNFG